MIQRIPQPCFLLIVREIFLLPLPFERGLLPFIQPQSLSYKMNRPTHCPVCDKLLGPPLIDKWCCDQPDHKFDMCCNECIFGMRLNINEHWIQLEYSINVNKINEIDIYFDYDCIFNQEKEEITFQEAIDMINNCKNNLVFL